MYGEVLKTIRTSKNYSQQKVAAGKFTQATYSYFEKNKSDISASNFIFLLDQLQISLDELIFLHNGYKNSESDTLLNNFFNSPYNDNQTINQLLDEIQKYLLMNPNHALLNELKIICEGLLLLISTGDIKAAQSKVIKIWDRISTYDEYYFMDMKMLNAILYCFEYETAKNIVKFLIINLNRYKDFKEARNVKNSVISNFAMICIINDDILKAEDNLLNLLKEGIQSISYVTLSTCFNRLAICYSFKSKEKTMDYLNKRQTLLSIYENEQLNQRLQNEFEKYCNKDFANEH